MSRVETYLTPPTPSSFPAQRQQLEFSSRALFFPPDGRRIFRVWGHPEHPWVLSVEGGESRWRIAAWGVDAGTARKAVHAMFSLDDPLDEFYRLVRREPVLRGSDRRFRGLRLPRDASLYEALFHSIIGQQLSVVAADAIKERIFRAWESYLVVDGVRVPHVPTPRSVLARGATTLRNVGLSRGKASSLLSLARGELDGRFDAGSFQKGDAESAIERLDQEPGVGRWTAENALLRGAGRRDMFVAGDLGLRVALERFGAVRRTASEDTARRWGDRWYPGWGSYATLYLWRRLVTDGVAKRPV